MSFIFEQLKKSGKKRQIELVLLKQMKKSKQNQDQQPVSDFNTLTEPLPLKQKKRAFLFYLIPALLVISACILIWLQYPLHYEKPNNAVQTFFENKQIPEKSESMKEINAIHEPASFAKSVKTEPDTQKISTNKNSIKTLQPETEINIINDKSSFELQANTHDESEKAQKALDFNELPASVQKNLPVIKITSHLYNKGSRLVSINGRILTEGYNLDNGLCLDKITPDGVILTYGKYRFHIKAY